MQLDEITTNAKVLLVHLWGQMLKFDIQQLLMPGKFRAIEGQEKTNTVDSQSAISPSDNS